MIRRIIQYVLLGIWLIAWWGVAQWTLMAKYFGWQHVAFFVAGLGLGLVAKDLLLGEQRYVILPPQNKEQFVTNGQVNPHDAVTAPARVGERL